MPELKGRRELFCREYLAKNLCARDAAEAAGYGKERAVVTGCELLAKPEVQARIAELAAARNQRLEITADEVLLELRRMLHADAAKMMDEHGCVVALQDIPIDLRRTIASFEVEEIWRGQGEARTQVGVLKKVKFWNKERAAELLGKHLRLFVDRVETQHSGNVTVLTGVPDEAERV